MSITVNTPFMKRSALRELASYFYQGRLSREDYVRCRTHLIDHLCHLEAQLDPVVQMLLRAAENNQGEGVDITEPQVTAPQHPQAARKTAGKSAADAPDTTRVMGARPGNATARPGNPAKATSRAVQQKEPNAVLFVIGIFLITILIATSVWFLMK
ncbi:MAG TPA: hypothetical protein PLF22_07995 [Pseudomonadales bacterium]|nr:hypothetical protein [Pseudomonadales bacterium]